MLEQIILSSLVYNEEFSRKVLPFLKEDYFVEPTHRWSFKIVSDFINKYNKLPPKEALLIDAATRGMGTNEFNETESFLKNSILPSTDHNIEWLVDSTEKFCQDRAVYNAVYSAIEILDDKTDKAKPRTAIPSILQEALSVSFDSHIGHDFLDDAGERYDFYHKVENRLPCDIEMLNIITRGGFPAKTLNVFAGGVGFGKTQWLCHLAACNLMKGKKVLYITLEMAEEQIGSRIDANLLNVDLDDLSSLSRVVYDKKIENLRRTTPGKLIIHEYAPASAGAANFRHLLHELRIKKNFVPDIIFVDYLNLCLSSRIKYGNNIGMYQYVKSVAEEIRGLAVENKCPIMSATQVNRTGFVSSDPGMEDTSESFGLPATVDFMGIIVHSEELTKLGQVMFKQVKNRYTDVNKNTRFIVGVHGARMKLYDVEQKAQNDVMGHTTDNLPVFDKGAFAKAGGFEGFK